MRRRPPSSTLSYTLLTYSAHFRSEGDMGAPQRRHARGDGRAERFEADEDLVVRPRVDGQAVVAVGGRAAVAGEVLGAGGYASALGGGDPGDRKSTRLNSSH